MLRAGTMEIHGLWKFIRSLAITYVAACAKKAAMHLSWRGSVLSLSYIATLALMRPQEVGVMSSYTHEYSCKNSK